MGQDEHKTIGLNHPIDNIPRMESIGYFFKEFSIFFVPILVIFIALLFMVYFLNYSNIISTIKQEESHKLEIKFEQVRGLLAGVIADVEIFTARSELKQFEYLSESEKEKFTREIYSVIKARGVYDQIRFIRSDGMELFRATEMGLENPRLDLVLQNKSDRYYFSETSKISGSQIYISEFDLNVENGIIEWPLKPVIRFGKPVFDKHGGLLGIAVFNYKGQQILDRIDSDLMPGSSIYYINENGDILLSPDDSQEWSFMLKDTERVVFDDIHPEFCETFSPPNTGVITCADTLYIYKSFTDEELFKKDSVISDGAHWTAVTVVSQAVFDERMNSFFGNFIIFAFVVMIVNCFILIFLTRARIERRIALVRLEDAAYYDHLTALLNRRSFLELFSYEIKRATRSNDPMGIILGDIDHFKKVNDTYGHEAGDVVLKYIASFLVKAVRAQDLVCRWGGEEFIILLPSTDISGVVRKAEDICKQVADLDIPYRDDILKVTISLGVSRYREGVSLDEVIAKADKLLYQSKQNGRNRVTYNY